LLPPWDIAIILIPFFVLIVIKIKQFFQIIGTKLLDLALFYLMNEKIKERLLSFIKKVFSSGKRRLTL